MRSDASRVNVFGTSTKTPWHCRSLIRYLMRHNHTTPFEMCEFVFHVRVPMDCWRRWIRHRTANEHSTRYSEAIDSMQCTEGNAWRWQSKNSKLGSAGTLVRCQIPMVREPERRVPGLLVVGPDASGKTTLHQAIGSLFPNDYRVTTSMSSKGKRVLNVFENAESPALQHMGRHEKLVAAALSVEGSRSHWLAKEVTVPGGCEPRHCTRCTFEIRTIANPTAGLVKPIVPFCW